MVDVRFARRLAILSCTTVRNIAYYYAGWVTGNGRGRLKDDSELGRTINSNFIGIAVLEWAKLFVDWDAYKYEGDLWGLLANVYNVPYELHWLVMRLTRDVAESMAHPPCLIPLPSTCGPAGPFFQEHKMKHCHKDKYSYHKALICALNLHS